MYVSLEGHVAVITGAASGIGRSMVTAFVESGAAVIAADIDDAGVERTRALVLETTPHAQVIAVHCDVADAVQVEDLVKQAELRFGHLSTMVNNAAISLPGNVVEASISDFDRTIAVNLRSVFLGCKFAVPALLRNGGGSIINMGSVNSLVAEPVLTSYTASKGGVLMLTRSVALDFARAGIRANCICPGWVDTPINLAHAERMGGIDHVRATLGDRQPIGREGRPDEIASLAVFLASDRAAFITGAALAADGGLTAI
jgi:meso-butanediol dehydrogenase / (S,S)-butanediol dehydrogenase / diacetyl reductase